MKKLLLLEGLLFIMIFGVNAQNDTLPWKKAIQTGINLSQASFSDNWKGGGTNSLAFGTFFNGKINYESREVSFNNDVKLAYGFVQNQGQESRKMADQIFLDSKVGWKFGKYWNLFGSLNFQTQFEPGYEYGKDASGKETAALISKFMAPGYLTSSIGFEYKPVEYWWIRFGTGTLRQTFVVDTTLYKNSKTVENNYGVEKNKKVKNEIALQLIGSFDKDIAKNLNFKFRFMALAPYEHFGSIVSRLDAGITARVNKFINVTISGTILNDINQDAKVQYNQFFGLGILYSFSQFKEK